MRVALIKNAKVVNIILSDVLIHTGYTAVESSTAQIGDDYVDNVITPKPVVYSGVTTVADAPANIVPTEISNIQAFEAIKHYGLLPAVQAYMDALPADDLTRVTWEKAAVFKRNSPTLLSISAYLGLGSAQIDEMFIYGASIKV